VLATGSRYWAVPHYSNRAANERLLSVESNSIKVESCCLLFPPLSFLPHTTTYSCPSQTEAGLLPSLDILPTDTNTSATTTMQLKAPLIACALALTLSTQIDLASATSSLDAREATPAQSNPLDNRFLDESDSKKINYRMSVAKAIRFKNTQAKEKAWKKKKKKAKESKGSANLLASEAQEKLDKRGNTMGRPQSRESSELAPHGYVSRHHDLRELTFSTRTALQSSNLQASEPKGPTARQVW
jgi:hypothetical protein